MNSNTYVSLSKQEYPVTESIKMCEAYTAQFGLIVWDQDKSWTPHVACEY